MKKMSKYRSSSRHKNSERKYLSSKTYHPQKKRSFYRKKSPYGVKDKSEYGNKIIKSHPHPTSSPKSQIPNTIQYEGYTYQSGNFNSPDLETVMRESQKYTKKGMDVHIKEIEGSLYLYYRKVPKDLPLMLNPNHPGSKITPDNEIVRDESDPLRKDWIDNKIYPYWLDGISRAEYIKKADPNDPLYCEEDFSFDPSTGKIKTDYGWKSLNEFPKISEIDPQSLKLWIMDERSTVGAMRGTKINKELQGKKVTNEFPSDIDEEEEEEEEEEEFNPKTSMRSTRYSPGKKDLKESIKDAAGNVGGVLKTSAVKGSQALKDYADWVEKKNNEAYTRERGHKTGTYLNRGEDENNEETNQRRNDRYNRVMGLTVGGNSGGSRDENNEETNQRRNDRYNRVMGLTVGGNSGGNLNNYSPRVSKNPNQWLYGELPPSMLLEGQKSRLSQLNNQIKQIKNNQAIEEKAKKERENTDRALHNIMYGFSLREPSPSNTTKPSTAKPSPKKRTNKKKTPKRNTQSTT